MTTNRITRCLIVLLNSWAVHVALAGSVPEIHQSINVVLVAIGSDSSGKSLGDGDWKQWQTESPKLLSALEKEAGFVRGDASHPIPEANLFAFACADRGLGESQTPALLQERLVEIFGATHCPSLLVFWLKKDSAAALAYYDGKVETLKASLSILENTIHATSRQMADFVNNRGQCFPPYVLASHQGMIAERNFDDLITEGQRREILSVLAVQDLSVQQVTEENVNKLLPTGATIQTVVIDIPGIESQGETRPGGWGKVLIGSDAFAQHNVQHEGVLGGNFQKAELGTTTILPHDWNASQAGKVLSPVLGDLSAGKNVYVKIDQNMKLETYLTTGKLDEGKWVVSVGNALIDRIHEINPDAHIIINAHSKGTIDALNLNLKHVSSVIIASPRESLAEVTKVVTANPDTKFTVIVGDRDLPHGLEPGFMKLDKPNAQVINLKSGSWIPTEVHGQVTDPSFKGTFEVQAAGRLQTVIGTLGQVYKDSWASSFVAPNHGAANTGFRTLANAPDMRPDKAPLPQVPDRKVYYLSRNQFFGGSSPPGPPGGGSGRDWPPGGGGSGVPVLASSRFTGPSARALDSIFPLTSRMPYQMASANVRPGGILFAPELEIVADTTGLTASRAEQAIAAVKGKAGGEFTTTNGEHFIAVKQPGSAKLFQVRAGRFHLMETDLEIVGGNGTGASLSRYYDSGDTNASELGQGWSFLPFSLRVGSTTKAGKNGIEVASKPLLIDRERGIEIAYQMFKPNDAESASTANDAMPTYVATQPGIQPFLAVTIEGGYTLTYAHGFQIGFDKNGRLEWMGRNEDERVRYTFEGNRLMRIASATSEIRLKYNANSRLTNAETVDGRNIVYQMNNDGRLAAIEIAGRPVKSFGYAYDGRLKNVEKSAEDGTNQIVVENTYDNLGRMLVHRTQAGGWSCKYDDAVGCAVTTDVSGKSTTHYYDGNSQLVASGISPKNMRLFNYDVYGRVIQVAEGELLNDPSKGERPKFRVLKILSDLTQTQTTKANKG